MSDQVGEIEIPKPKINSESSLIRSGSSLNLMNKKETEEKKAQTLKGGLKKKDVTFGEKIKRSFVKEDLKDIRDYLIFDMIIPNLKEAAFNTLIGTVAQIFGVSAPTRSFRAVSRPGYGGNIRRLTPHERQYRDYNSIQNQNQIFSSRDNYDRYYVNDFEFDFKEDAESVLEQMMDICDTYGWVSVAKFFEIADPEGTVAGRNAYTNNDFGWRNIDGSTVKFDGSGYIITFPPARPRN